MWSDLCAALGCGELTADSRFRLNEDRLRHRAQLAPLLEAAAAKISSGLLLTALATREVPAAPINTLDRAFADAQVRHRDMVVQMTDSEGASIKVAGNPVKFAGLTSRQHAYPHRLGADTAAILREQLGLSAEKIADLARQGVIAVV
jgi:crotonobetainyl-CoA:carnitine CoA-transferase CaiB-like acyl-CoA transferase